MSASREGRVAECWRIFVYVMKIIYPECTQRGRGAVVSEVDTAFMEAA